MRYRTVIGDRTVTGGRPGILSVVDVGAGRRRSRWQTGLWREGGACECAGRYLARDQADSSNPGRGNPGRMVQGPAHDGTGVPRLVAVPDEGAHGGHRDPRGGVFFFFLWGGFFFFFFFFWFFFFFCFFGEKKKNESLSSSPTPSAKVYVGACAKLGASPLIVLAKIVEIALRDLGGQDPSLSQ